MNVGYETVILDSVNKINLNDDLAISYQVSYEEYK